MATLGELMEKFASDSSDEESSAAGDAVVPDGYHAANGGGEQKLASGGNAMASLSDMYMRLTQQDMDKHASAAADVPEQYEEDVDFAKMASFIAEAEAEEIVSQEYDGGDDMMKIAAEYDSAGRLMARGFLDEYVKLASALGIKLGSDNQMADSESESNSVAFGERGLPTLPTNFAGTENHDGQMETSGPAPKQVYADVLKAKASMSAGTGTMGDLTGSTLGSIATVRDLQA